jgi:hypothetical protein
MSEPLIERNEPKLELPHGEPEALINHPRVRLVRGTATISCCF